MPEVRMVSPLEKLNASPSTGGFIELLEGIASGTTVLSDQNRQSLRNIAAADILPTHIDVIEFDAALWSALSRVRWDISWALVDAYRYPPSPPRAESELSEEERQMRQQMSKLAHTLVELESQPRLAMEEAKKKSGDLLSFFADINQFFVHDAAFGHFVARSKEISDLLIPLCTAPHERYGSSGRPRLRDADMAWFTMLAARSYAALLGRAPPGTSSDNSGNTAPEPVDQQHSSPDDNIARASEEIVALYSILLITATANYATDSFPENPIAVVLSAARLVNLDGPLSIFRVAETVSGNDGAAALSTMLLPITYVTAGTRFVSAAAWHVLLDAWLPERYEMTHDEDEPYFVVNALLCAIPEHLEPTVTATESALFLNGIRASEVSDYLGSKFERAPTVELATAVLREVGTYSDLDDYLEPLAEWMCKTLRDNSAKAGFPTSVPFISDIRYAGPDALFNKRPAYYGCLSTLALNLNDLEEPSQTFRFSTASTCFLRGAQTLLEGGFPEHATAFLAYGLLRMQFVISGTTKRLAVAPLAAFLDQSSISPFVRKYIVPALRLIRDHQPALDTFDRIWIDSFLDRHSRPSAKILTFSEVGKDRVRESTQGKPFQPPPWFHDVGDSVEGSLREVNRVLSRNDLTDDSWAVVCNRGRALGDLTQICKQLEAEAKHLFSDFYDLYRASQRFVYALSDAARKSKVIEGDHDLGWVEQFIRLCAFPDEPHRTKAPFSAAVEEANKYRAGMGEQLRSLRAAPDLASDLGRFRILRNEYVGHTESRSTQRQRGARHQLSLSNARWLFSYATADFGSLWRMMRRDSH